MQTGEWAFLDVELKSLESAGRAVAEALGIPLVAVEKWRWDDPSVTFTWVDDRGVWRAIHCRALMGQPAEIQGVAWVDADVDSLRERRWRHESLGTVTRQTALRNLYGAFEALSGWTPNGFELVDRHPTRRQ